MLAPPAYHESLTPAQWTVGSRVRLVVTVAAIAMDLLLWLLLPDSTRIDADAVVRFASINIPVLTALAALDLAQLRGRLRHMSIVYATVVVEAFTVVVWIQTTGTLTTYFVMATLILVVWYRLYFGFRVGATVTAALLAFHGGAIALEIAGVIAPKPLFIGPPGPEYTETGYQVALVISMGAIYIALFVGTNAIVNKLREKDLALAEVRRAAQQAQEQVRHGRLTGALLADEYALGELLGRGGMGEVYVARRVSDDAAVALKVLHGHLLSDEVAVERFRREAMAGARVPAEHVAKLYTVGRDDTRDLDFIAMEYLRGEDLGAYLRRKGPLDTGAMTSLVSGMADALDAAHDAGVVHRDLKPQNVFLVDCDAPEWPQVRLLDFGLSKFVVDEEETLTKTHAVIGTVAFMAPEQALGNRSDIGPATDRFALAVIAYRALTGRLPFETPDLVAAINEIAHAIPPVPSSLRTDLSRDVDAVFAIALAKAPASRYESARAFADDLAAALTGELSDESRNRAAVVSGATDMDDTLTAVE